MNSSFWEFLNESGVLEKGNDEEIKEVKKAYRKKYFSEFKRKQRKNNPEFTIHFSKSNHEYEQIVRAAKKHNLSIPFFIKSASLAYLNRSYVVPNRLMIAKLEQLLSNCLNEIKSISIKRENFWERGQKLERIEKIISELEEEMTKVFRDPSLYSHDHQNKIT